MTSITKVLQPITRARVRSKPAVISARASGLLYLSHPTLAMRFGTSRSCLEPTLARTFSHPTKESESIDFDPGFPYRGCPGALLLNELVGKFLRREASRFHAELGDACLHFRYFEPFIHSRIELSDDRFRGSSRSKQAEPNVSWHSGDSAFRHCRHVWKLWPSRLAGHGHRSQPSFFDEREEHRF